MPRVKGHNRCIDIEYVDGEGVLSRRTINVRSLHRPSWMGGWYIEAFCQLKKANRTFRSDGIRRLWDGRGRGEPVTNVGAWCESLYQAERQGLSESGRRAVQEDIEVQEKLEAEAESVINQHYKALKVLLYVAKADKAFRQGEKRLFALFLKRVAGHRMDSEALQARCLELAFGLDAPNTAMFYRATNEVAKSVRRYRMAVCATAKAMLNTDKRVTPYEAEVMAYLEKKLTYFDT